MNAVKMILEEFERETIWFWIDENVKDRFRAEIEELHVKWKDGSQLEKTQDISNRLAIHPDHTIAFISGMAWSFSFAKPYRNTIIKIDYQKWISKEISYRIWNH